MRILPAHLAADTCGSLALAHFLVSLGGLGDIPGYAAWYLRTIGEYRPFGEITPPTWARSGVVDTGLDGHVYYRETVSLYRVEPPPPGEPTQFPGGGVLLVRECRSLSSGDITRGVLHVPEAGLDLGPSLAKFSGALLAAGAEAVSHG